MCKITFIPILQNLRQNFTLLDTVEVCSCDHCSLLIFSTNLMAGPKLNVVKTRLRFPRNSPPTTNQFKFSILINNALDGMNFFM